ncbi:MAG TPA: hemolysin family protein [Fimbriimonas sp.]|nr:hemolysin family protein [Fimbriimonas sp.]
MWFPSLLLIFGSLFFVAAEYSLVGARKSRLETLARQGNKGAKSVAKALENVSTYVATSQVGITMIGIGVGSITEPYVTELLSDLFKSLLGSTGISPSMTKSIGFVISFIIVTFVLVVIGELCPKYYTLRHAERVALLTFPLMRVVTLILYPIAWLAQSTAALLLRPLGVDLNKADSEAVPKEELYMLVQAGGQEGVLERTHAEMLSRALRLDALHARDIMIHRLDIKWVDVSLDRNGLLERLREIPFTRLPVCKGDIDDLIGIIYVHDVVKHLDDPDFTVEKITRPAVAVPENLSLDRIVETMRTEKTQMLIVMDEYGGTSGLLTLEDVVEEVFGELEDRLESERPVVEEFSGGRVSARAEVRIDELVTKLKLNYEAGDDTRTLAQIIVDALERVPRPGDHVDTDLGILRVENMARRRITRVTINLKPSVLRDEETDG